MREVRFIENTNLSKLNNDVNDYLRVDKDIVFSDLKTTTYKDEHGLDVVSYIAILEGDFK